jgi:FeS assembly SUF system protein
MENKNTQEPQAAEAPQQPALNHHWETEDSPVKLKEDVIAMLKTVFDPEIPVNIYELGLIYNVDISEDKKVDIKLTLTSPSCPVAGTLPGEVEAKVKSVPGVADCKIELVWEPTWNASMMSEMAKLKLNMF